MKKISFIAALCLCMTMFAGCGEMEKMMDAAKEAAESVLDEKSSEETTEEETTEEASEEETTEEATEESEEQTTEAAEETTEAEIAPAQVSEGVLYESENLRITFTGEEESFGDYDLNMKIENLTDKSITIISENVSVCDVMVEAYMYAEVPAGDTVDESLSFYSMDLEMNNINELGTVEFSLIVSDTETYETIEETDFITLKLRDTSSYKRNEGTVIYDENGFKVTYTGIVEDEYMGDYVVFEIENTTGKNITVSADDVSIDGTAYDGIMYNDIRDGKYTNAGITFFDDIDLSAAESVEFSLQVYDYDSYDTIIESHPVTVELN